jgi:hypothetical protein
MVKCTRPGVASGFIFGMVAGVTMNQPDPADALAQKQCLYVLRVTKT